MRVFSNLLQQRIWVVGTVVGTQDLKTLSSDGDFVPTDMMGWLCGMEEERIVLPSTFQHQQRGFLKDRKPKRKEELRTDQQRFWIQSTFTVLHVHELHVGNLIPFICSMRQGRDL